MYHNVTIVYSSHISIDYALYISWYGTYHPTTSYMTSIDCPYVTDNSYDGANSWHTTYDSAHYTGLFVARLLVIAPYDLHQCGPSSPMICHI